MERHEDFFSLLKILFPSGGGTGNGAPEGRGVHPVGHDLAHPHGTEPPGHGHPSGGAPDARAHPPVGCLAGPGER